MVLRWNSGEKLKLSFEASPRIEPGTFGPDDTRDASRHVDKQGWQAPVRIGSAEAESLVVEHVGKEYRAPGRRAGSLPQKRLKTATAAELMVWACVRAASMDRNRSSRALGGPKAVPAP